MLWSLAASRQVLRTQYHSIPGLSQYHSVQRPQQILNTGNLSSFLQPHLSAKPHKGVND